MPQYRLSGKFRIANDVSFAIPLRILSENTVPMVQFGRCRVAMMTRILISSLQVEIRDEDNLSVYQKAKTSSGTTASCYSCKTYGNVCSSKSQSNASAMASLV